MVSPAALTCVYAAAPAIFSAAAAAAAPYPTALGKGNTPPPPYPPASQPLAQAWALPQQPQAALGELRPPADPLLPASCLAPIVAGTPLPTAATTCGAGGGDDDDDGSAGSGSGGSGGGSSGSGSGSYSGNEFMFLTPVPLPPSSPSTSKHLGELPASCDTPDWLAARGTLHSCCGQPCTPPQLRLRKKNARVLRSLTQVCGPLSCRCCSAGLRPGAWWRHPLPRGHRTAVSPAGRR
jgi:hypothetical protein